MLSSSRNQNSLSPRKIVICQAIWELLGGNECCPLDISEAAGHGSRTRFNQSHNIVYLGADVEPGVGTEARVKMSEMACLAHEFAHAQRYRMGINRPVTEPEVFLDEAETSLHASFFAIISLTDRNDLVEDARIQIAAWQKQTTRQEIENEN